MRLKSTYYYTEKRARLYLETRARVFVRRVSDTIRYDLKSSIQSKSFISPQNHISRTQSRKEAWQSRSPVAQPARAVTQPRHRPRAPLLLPSRQRSQSARGGCARLKHACRARQAAAFLGAAPGTAAGGGVLWMAVRLLRGARPASASGTAAHA